MLRNANENCISIDDNLMNELLIVLGRRLMPLYPWVLRASLVLHRLIQ